MQMQKKFLFRVSIPRLKIIRITSANCIAVPLHYNIDFDTGLNTAPGEYGLADKTYYALLMKLNDKQFATISPPLQQNILSFYSQYKPDTHTKRKIREWHNTENALAQLKNRN